MAEAVLRDSVALRTAEAVSPGAPADSISDSLVNTPTSSQPVSHLRYLEGLRGLAAIVVTLQHIFYHTAGGAALSGWQANVAAVLSWLFPGRAAVSVFIVLSGYLLMRPVMRQGTGQIPDGTGSYLRRRGRRILPPYYAALTISIALMAAIPLLRQPISNEWADAVRPGTPLGTKNILAHLLLVHNLSYKWASRIDPPMWTIATEWQIYFLFPLILLPVWRRLGSGGSIVVGLALGLGLFFVTGRGHAAAPWFLGLFAFGNAAAAREARGKFTVRERRIFGWLAAICFAIYAVITFQCAFGMLRCLTVEGLNGLWPYNWEFDLLTGIAAASFLVFAAASKASGQPHRLVKWLSSRWLVRTGVASYTLYLIHDPILAVVKLGLNRVALGPWEQFAAMLFLGGSIVGVATYFFHIVFERPFMNAARVRGAEG